MTLQEFIKLIKTKDVEGNMTYVYATTKKCKYGQSYQNQTSTIEDMINRFAVFYYDKFVAFE